MARIWVQSSKRRRSILSANTPATGVSRKEGSCPAKPVSPSSRAEPDRRYTSQIMALCCPLRDVLQIPFASAPPCTGLFICLIPPDDPPRQGTGGRLRRLGTKKRLPYHHPDNNNHNPVHLIGN